MNPLAVVFHRKIWAQSLLPLLAMVFLLGWWYRKRHWAGAFVWGLAGALLGQIHMAGFFLAASVVAWTILFDSERRTVHWIAWAVGTVLGSLGLIPWLLELGASTGQGSPAFNLSAWFNFKWWNYWVSNNSGIVMEHFLGDHFWSFLGYPLIGRQPTYLVGAVKNGDGWTMALYPGKLERGEKPDLSKAIKLDSQLNTSTDGAEHLVVDIGPGWGKNQGKAVVLIGFGTLWLDGAISDAQ